MKNTLKKLLLSVFFLSFCITSEVVGQPSMLYGESITRANLVKHLSFLASDSLEGRETGKKGQEIAAHYIAKQMEEYGLKSPFSYPTQAHIQNFQVIDLKKEDNYIETKSEKLYLFDDFVVFTPFITEGIEKTEFVWAGYGIEHPNYSDYKNLNVKDKVVIVATGEPRTTDGRYWLSKDSTKATIFGRNSYKQQMAFNKGAKAIFIMPTNPSEFEMISSKFFSLLTQDTLELPKDSNNQRVCYISLEGVSKILKISQKQIMRNIEEINNTLQNTSKHYAEVANFKIKDARVKIPTANVIGFIEGTTKKDEVLVISAHYDHIGVENGAIYNGADDNASGVSAILEMARVFQKAAQEGHKPTRTIAFILFSAEEKGLLGSYFYTMNPVFPLEKTVTNLNIDMIGRIDEAHTRKPDYVYVIGADRISKELHKINQQIAKKTYPDLKLDFSFDTLDDPNQYYYRSDHYNFAQHHIPVIFYFDGEHPDYHKPTDDIAKIEWKQLEQRTKLIFQVAWELAYRPNKVIIDKK